jgi:hypothetical protein
MLTVDMKKILYVGYVSHKRTINGLLVSPMMDSLILSRASLESATSMTLGQVEGQELVDSQCVPENIPVLQFLRAQFTAGFPRIVDLKFVFDLFRPNIHSSLILPVPRWQWRIFAIRSYLIARYYSTLFKVAAANHDEARVLVYYGARMLGVVMAFRRLEKPVFDVQHGYIGISHNAYNRAEICNTDSLFEPTGYVLWSKDFHERTPGIINKCATYTDYLHLKFFGLANVVERNLQPNVLVATQWGTPLPSFLALLVHSFPTVLWTLRLHPLEADHREDLMPLLSKSNVKKSEPGKSLATDLFCASLQITVNSSTVHEAAALGVRSLFTDPVGIERFAFEVERGLACYVDEANVYDEIQKMIDLIKSTAH